MKIKEQPGGGRARRTRSGGSQVPTPSLQSRTREPARGAMDANHNRVIQVPARAPARAAGLCRPGSGGPGPGAAEAQEQAPRPPRDDDDREDIPIDDQSADLKRFLVGLLAPSASKARSATASTTTPSTWM